MVSNAFLDWLRGRFKADAGGRPVRKITGLGVTSFQGSVWLIYQAANSGQLLAAKSRDGLSFQFSHKVSFLPHEESSLLEQMRFYHHDTSVRLQYKTLKKHSWSAAETSNFQTFQPISDSTVIEPVVELQEPDQLDVVRFSGDKNIFAGNGEKLALIPRRGSFDDGALVPELCFSVEEGIMLIYSSRKRVEGVATFSIGAALFDREDTTKLLWRSEKTLWEQKAQWEGKNAWPIGIVLFDRHVYLYLNVEGEGVHVVLLPLTSLVNHMRYHSTSPKLERHDHNPLIAPTQKNAWEAFTTFNPAALYADEKFHIVYRAQGHDYVSVLGYASSKDGVHVDEKLDMPIYVPSEQFELVNEKPAKLSYQYMSGGYGGSEDPRLTLIDETVYMTYVAFDGINPPRVALTSIDLENFLSHNWQWEKPVLISPPGVVDKNAVIFPEKIHGKYVIMHRIFPDILIDFVDTLKFNGMWWLEGSHKISPRPDKWDSRKIGAGPPPLKTEEGWLLIYQSVGNQDPGKYKIGAMLLDLDDPTKVLYRSQNPILEPEEWYENEGFKAGVVYPCGAVIKDGILFVYYGGADSHVCVATAVLEEFLDHLKRQEEISLTPAILPLSV